MKYEKLKRQVVIETSIAVIVMVIMGAIIYVISSICNDYEASNSALQQKVDAIDLQAKALRGRFTNIQKNILDYHEVERKLDENSLGINRQLILEKFNQLKTQYSLDGLHLTVSPAKDLSDAIFKHKTSNVNFSEVSAVFETTTDEGVFQLINSLREELPGITKLTRLDLDYQKPFNKDAIKELSTKGTYPMVRTEIQFIWFGINYIPPPSAATNVKPDAPKN